MEQNIFRSAGLPRREQGTNVKGPGGLDGARVDDEDV